MQDISLYHEKNLKTKINTNYHGKKELFKRFKEKVYNLYKGKQISITNINKKAIERKVLYLSRYYNEVDKLNTGNWITFQSKFRPTILEEFCIFLFKDIPEVKALGLSFFNKGIYAGISINSSGDVIIKTKDVDFCIGKEVKTDFGNSKYTIIIPLIAIECKTYIDKTMFSESQFTAQKLKQGSPDVKVYVLSEENRIGKNEIPLKGQTPIDQVFIIRDEDGKLDVDSIYEFFLEIKNSINKVTKESIIKIPGKLLPE